MRTTCGATWYTGAAGWMYRVWIEEMLGMKIHGDEMTLDPVIPGDWPGFSLRYKRGQAVYSKLCSGFGRGEVCST